MSIKRGFVFLVVCGLSAAAPYYDDEKVYYWKRYSGVIPNDAVTGGKNNQDAITYIGQVFFEGAIIPTEIRPNQSTVSFIWAGPKTTGDNIKILCSKHPENFEWLKVNERNYKYLWSKHIVIGGFHISENRPILVGRILHQNKVLIIGEVLVNDKEIRIYYNVDGAEFSVANTDMELLAYVPNDQQEAPVEERPPAAGQNGFGLPKIFNFNFC